MSKRPKPQMIEEAIKPIEERKVYNDWHDDGLKILDLLLSKNPDHQSAIAKLYADCPWKYSIDTKTGRKIPVTAHTVAAWAGNEPKNKTGYVARLRAAGLIR